uniref:Tr-type G domain-containing protein n=1 Tax=Glycine max TaxID=3847 RepID=A0A0R0F3B5_SOYBN
MDFIGPVLDLIIRMWDSLPASSNEIPLEATVGLESTFDELSGCFDDNHVGVIGLYGIGGVGKTTQLKKFNNEFLPTKFYDVSIWAVVSRKAPEFGDDVYEARNQGEEIIASLKLTCLLEDRERENRIKMHDMIRDMALWLACDHGSNTRFLVKDDACSRKSDCSNLSTMIVRNSELTDLSDEIFLTANTLGVLDLSGNKRVKELHAIIGELVSLQHLDLSGTGIQELPRELQNLKKLSTTREKSTIDLSQYPTELVRNFSIIAYVDHGKFTLADRLLELTGTIKKGHGQPQYLDKLQVERERGITVKAQTATMFYKHSVNGNDCNDGKEGNESPKFLLNLIDTPGHVDFSYEVSSPRLTMHKIDQPTSDPDCAKAQLKSYADGSDFEALNHAIERLTCNDASVSITKETSTALGLGFRCGFLGLLHMDVFHQRLEQEYGAHVISTVPTVPYVFEFHDGSKLEVQNPASLPSNPKHKVTACWEPTVLATIIIPSEYVGPVITLVSERRGQQLEYSFIDSQRVFMKYCLPLREIVVDFYNELKSITSGYASFDYEDSDYQQADMVKLDILLNGQPVDAMATIVHNTKAYRVGRELTEKLKGVLDRISAMRKNVLAKCYGGDVSRKRKLLEKQKEGKKRMKRVGSVDVPQEAFHELLKVS